MIPRPYRTSAHTASRALAATALALSLLAPIGLAAQDLPAARTLVDRYVEAIGGREAVLRPGASRTTGTFSIPAAGLEGDLLVVTDWPNRMVSKVTIAGMGEMLSGFDGEHAWSLDPMAGARVLSGPELDAVRDQADQLASVRDSSLFTTMETVERTEVGGDPCYRVRLVWKSGRESSDCYAVDSGLLVGTFTTQESAMGEVDVVSHIGGYREFGGVLMPTRVEQQMMGMQQIMTIDTVVFDGVDTSLIEPPAPIRTLIGGGS